MTTKDIVAHVKKRKRGRPRNTPDSPECRLTPKIRAAIISIVEEGKRIDEAAALAGLTTRAVYKALTHGTVQQFYVDELKALRTLLKARALNVLAHEMEHGTNAAARVAAARTVLQETDGAPVDSRMPQQPGFSFLVIDARGSPQSALPIGNSPLIDHVARGLTHMEPSNG